MVTNFTQPFVEAFHWWDTVHIASYGFNDNAGDFTLIGRKQLTH
ncbi:Uncharacterised protein [Vibrio cholerae]|nr:Uncharacterised protein [Vibrio cholerae]CSC61353.1 Uncharacterised protein [Vibrio cholerae]CSI55680.1 Uncharacterised protein [Vibrio cholerae]CSI57214.1 Uncharacterised protein [Vibrio cholerae]